MDLASAFEPLPPGSGPIGLLSSDELLAVAKPFDQALLEVSRGVRVGVIVAAQGKRGAPQASRMALRYYRSLGADPFIVDVLEREDAQTHHLPECDVLFLTGGSPQRLLDIFRDTPMWSDALARWQYDGMTLAGSSAGAMVLCAQCLVPNPGDFVPTKWSLGIGPLLNVGVAVHASSRDATWIQSIKASAPCPIVALDDGTGVILHNNDEPLIKGPGKVWVP